MTSVAMARMSPAIIAGNGAASTGTQYSHTFYGIARQANILNVKVLDTQGQGTVSNVIAGVQWCITNRSKYSIRVMNLPWGIPWARVIRPIRYARPSKAPGKPVLSSCAPPEMKAA